MDVIVEFYLNNTDRRLPNVLKIQSKFKITAFVNTDTWNFNLMHTAKFSPVRPCVTMVY